MKIRIFAVVLALILTLSALSGCGTPAQAADLMSGLKANEIKSETNLSGSGAAAVADFAASLFKNSFSSDKNTLISPVSVLCALAMTANGAGGETLSQMESVFGLTVPELNSYLHAYINALPSGEKYKFSLADSIWFKDDDKLTVNQDFLQTNADYYNASIYKSAFDDAALKEINNWVKDKTDGMIDKIIDSIPADAVMYLINALSFDAEWMRIYNKTDIRQGAFTAASGESKNADMMYSEEHKYLDDGSATGFIKYYADGKYAFAALLPNEGISINDYVSSLTGAGISETLVNAQSLQVIAAIPKFESDYSVEMSDMLKSMGMNDAFDGNLANFSKLGPSDNGNIYISRVIHKTYIAVDERGTKAGAATAVEMTATSAPIDKPKTVILDHPFVYMIIDCETNLPLFIGTVMDTGK